MDFRFERIESGAVFTITRPDRLNALNRAVWDGLESCLDALERDGARFLLITAEGARAFSAGSDLKDNAIETWDQQAEKNDRIRNLLLRLSQSPVFTIAAINGAAFGGGLELALACTVRAAVNDATFAMPEIRLGVMPTYGGTQFLPAIVGRSRAAELMLTGRVLNAREALMWGLVSFVKEDHAALLAHAIALGTEVAGFGAIAYRSILDRLPATDGPADQAGMDREAALMRRVLGTDDAKEGIAAFLEKRRPVFKGQ
ncbi:enoyl-CoA hydratase-related protein [Burkholderia cenocepacia]|uniref:enoyl-CoA hydratase-related protein n=1 Tax=Burkholderia cenocepacia TaxID=95486 RepID=UPI0026513F80|nr:enoyl-CoA hydratase-related protein [Burkholderia cenocepacia]MDN7682808.1 enoyl-CoA hydratase-related protein [Burkholderia cenocepacia]